MRLAPGSVFVEAQGAQSPDYAERGIGRYIGEQIGAVSERAPGLISSVYLDPSLPVPATLEPLLGSGLLGTEGDQPEAGSPVPAIYHITCPMSLQAPLDLVWPAWARSREVKTVATVYDLIPLIFRELYLDPLPVTRAAYFGRLGLLRRVDHLLTISERTAEDASELLGIPEARITVIDCGVSAQFSSQVGSKREGSQLLENAMPLLRDGFLLYVGGDDPRKNLKGALEGYALLPERVRHAHQFVIVCKLASERVAEYTSYALSLGIRSEDLLFTGFVSDVQLAALYRSCELFVFPSLYEGAGLPILEAMSCDAPVAASAASSIPEILGDFEATFDPADPADIAATLRRVLGDDEKLESLRERSRKRVDVYTWQRVAERTVEGYERALVAPRRWRAKRQRKRLAMFTPWPPQWTGVATHSRRVVEEIIAHADVDVILPANVDGVEFDRSLEPEVRLVAAPEFDWANGLRAYDRVLYALGGSPFHIHAFEALMRRPGAVLAHDVYLVGLYAPLQDRRRHSNPQWLEEKLCEMYGESLSPWDRRRVLDPRVWAAKNVFMTKEVQSQAEQIIVHSRYQRDVLRLDAPQDATPTDVAPLGVPTLPPAAGRNGASPHADPVIVTCGLVSVDAKRMPLLLEAFAELLLERPEARLRVVGQLPDAERERLVSLASNLELLGAVDLIGRVSNDMYWEILRDADLAVQLRAGVKGPSAAVCDLIAARVPTIATSLGSLREIPAPAILPVPEDCSAQALAARMAEALDDPDLQESIRAAQDDYAHENSFARVAERYVELLGL